MPVNITDVDQFTSPVTAPAGADARIASSVSDPIQKVSNRTRWLEKRLRSLLYHPPINWGEIDIGANRVVYDVAEDPNGLMIAVGSNTTTTQQIFSSVDYGRTWAPVTHPDEATDSFRHVHHDQGAGGGFWVASGSAGSGDPLIMRSADGTTWTDVTPALAGFSAIDGVFDPSEDDHVLIGAGAGTNARVFRSTDDGATWSEVNIATPIGGTNAPKAICYSAVNQRLVVVGTGGAIITSDDGGATWTSRTSGTGEDLCGVVEHPRTGVLHAVGQNGAHRTSLDGITWSAGGSMGSFDAGGLATLGGVLVAGSTGADSFLAISVDDGLSWQRFRTWRFPGTGTQIAMDTVRAVRNRLWVTRSRYLSFSDAFGEGTVL
jgi:photosystem II stability/assembly factor-like uncharacterized protein